MVINNSFSIDDIIESGAGYETEVGVSTPKARQNAVGYLSTVYENVPVALKEYAANETDANATEIYVVVDNGNPGYMMVAGNGAGMSLPNDQLEFAKMSIKQLEDFAEEYFNKNGEDAEDFIPKHCILRLPYRIADSFKEGIDGNIGDKGIGGLNWQGLGGNVVFYSKREGEDHTAWIASVKNNEHGKSRIKASVIDPRTNEGSSLLADIKQNIESELGLEGYFDSHGTAVMIRDIRKNSIKQSKGRNVADKLSSFLSMWLREDSNKAFVAEKTNKVRNPEWIKVEPNDYEGYKQIMNKTITAEHGPITVELYFSPQKSKLRGDKKSRVKVYNQNAEFLDDLNKQSELLGTPIFGSGDVIGEISLDWLVADTGRTGFGFSDKTEVFYQAIKDHVIDEIKASIKHLKKETSAQQTTQNTKDVLSAMKDVINSNLDFFYDLIKGANVNSKHKPKKGDLPTGSLTPEGEIKEDKPVGPPRGKRGPYKKRVPRKIEDGSTVRDGNKDIHQGKGTGIGLIVENSGFIPEFKDPAVLGFYETDNNQMYINEHSPAYIDAVSAGLGQDYMCKVTASEIVNFIYDFEENPRFRQIELEMDLIARLPKNRNKKRY